MKSMHLVFLFLFSLASAGLSPADTATKALHAAARLGDAAAVRAALDAGAAIDDVALSGPGGGGQSALMAASLGGHADVISLLLADGADARVGEKDGYTPLHGVAFQGRAEGARVLLAAGPNRVPHEPHVGDGIWPLHRACWGREERHASTVAAFLAAGGPGGDVRLRDRAGKTPLDHARASHAHPKTLLLLQEAEAAAAAAASEL